MQSVNYPPDPLTELDWADHWRRLVEAREEQVGGRPANFWDRRARAYSFSLSGTDDPLLAILEPYLAPGRTLIDVGAGSGRHSVPLAARLDWVTAVEPSEGMRALLPPVDNMTVVASRWEEAEVTPADLVLSAHVLYPVAAAVPFVEKMEASARERVFLSLRDGQLAHPAEQLWEQMTGQRRARQPQFYDAYNLLHWMGVRPDVAIFRHPVRLRFENLETALEDCRLRVGAPWDEASGRAWLEANLRQEADGTLLYSGGEMVNGVAHWRPRASK